MSQDASDDPRSERRTDRSIGRYSAIDVEGKALLVYDEQNEDAWVRSDTWTSL